MIQIITNPDKFNLRQKRWKLSKVIVNYCLQNYNWIEVLDVPVECWCSFHSWTYSIYIYVFLYDIRILRIWYVYIIWFGCVYFPPSQLAPFKYQNNNRYCMEQICRSTFGYIPLDRTCWWKSEKEFLILGFYCIIFIVIAIIVSHHPFVHATEWHTFVARVAFRRPVYPNVAQSSK